ncbi:MULTISPECIES: LPS translocon maturation chaperone LptM [Photobacterium]|nr:lipoprotein [Photobacterium sanguinicancri]MDO6545118.1 lipoprotein [Photobacterium sanguinicancri]
MRKGLLAILVLGVLAISGCGQSGALYMPQDADQQQQQ